MDAWGRRRSWPARSAGADPMSRSAPGFRQERKARRGVRRQAAPSAPGRPPSAPPSVPPTLLVASALAVAAPAHAAEITAGGDDCTLAEAIASANADSAAGNGCVDGHGWDVIFLGANAVLTAADPGSTVAHGGAAGLPDDCGTGDAGELAGCPPRASGWGLADPELLARLR